ncbi:tyrosine protein kinase:aminoglycoside phosphotransferase [Planobispora rosea]|uniref:Tyrosine protein kinase:aminoglycoside phosphotransferase n=1 Tax=Planobispora rosea TaxID=35762 RepID=A0A8J3SBI5_PLARO|nr:phosphotransferase family protein [Planobispora rosea]GGS77146.1 tyrosine protein kinase:aminoglycoside phosphotransferase [Planobispora rosea]GIH88704.1 tyrosine protein kinase:aminoglycoside phosphotransferase [Planobispora rosea]
MDATGRQAIVTAALGEGSVVTAGVRLPGGASRETWAIDALDAGGASHELILRLDSPGASPGAGIGLSGEAALMRAAAAGGVPVPRILSAGDGHVLMTRVAGETIPRKILRDEAFAAARPRLAGRCGEILAAIHRMPLSCLPQATPRPQAVPDDPLATWRDLLDLTGQPHPVFELGFRRLAASRPVSHRVTVVHGDFRNGNLVVGPDGVEAVLDWELAHAGDPLEDLGWLCVKAWRFGSPLPVGGFGEYAQLVESYEKASGHPVDPDALRWWETFGVLKWGVICIMQTMRHLSGGARSVELAAIGRRVCETEWDLLHLLQ